MTMQGFERQGGFTVVEIAVVITIIAIVGSLGLGSMGAFVDNAKQSKTQGNLEIAKRALLNYVKVNRHMPCPDVNGDGKVTDPQDRDGNRCQSHLGKLPYDDLGLSLGVARDEWGNVFSYGVHKQAADSAVMALNVYDTSAGGEAEALADSPGSYFYPERAPAFDLETPPTRMNADSAADSFTICKKYAADDCSGANDKELAFIQAVIVAFNENGGQTDLSQCRMAGRSIRERENCDGDMQLIKGVFNERTFDDQMVTVSGYEIKQQVLNLLNGLQLSAGVSESGLNLPDGFDYIVNKDMDSSNDLNVGTNDVNRFFISGDVNKSINTKQGDDVVAVMGSINKKIEAGSGSDTLYVSEATYPPGSDTESTKVSALQTLESTDNVDSFEKVCYYPSDEDFANTVCYSK